MTPGAFQEGPPGRLTNDPEEAERWAREAEAEGRPVYRQDSASWATALLAGFEFEQQMRKIDEIVNTPFEAFIRRNPSLDRRGVFGDLLGPTPAEVKAAELNRAIYRLGFPTPYDREIEDWLAADPPTWQGWPPPPF